MSGCFGLLDDGNPHHVPLERFTAEHSCVDVFVLRREGLLVVGASAWLETKHGGSRLEAREVGKIFIDGEPVVLGSHPIWPWASVFLCPQCQQTRQKLFRVAGRWACYRCHGLTHASRHVHRTIPGWHRLMRLRRKIGADPVPFTPIAPRPVSHRKYWRIVREIRALEAGLVGHVREDVADVLQRRHDRGR
jgi:hypothetical protein